MRSVKLSKSLADIGIGAFCNCSSLTRIKIPDSVSSIGRNAFAQCDSLKDIYFGGSEAHWTALNVEIPPAATVHCNVNLQEKAPATSTLNGQVSPSADQATEGWSTKGTQLMDVVYNSDGTIHSLLERSGDIWTYWEYVYSRSGTFLYRKTNIGTPNFRWSHRYMPGTDITYCIMEDTIESCVEFTLEYEVTEVTKGDGLEPRDLYFQSENDSWQKVGMFEYNTYRKASRHFILNYPMSMQAFATPRQHPDDSSFSVSQRMTDIWIADYDYVQVAE